jgi:hypothetical protein
LAVCKLTEVNITTEVASLNPSSNAATVKNLIPGVGSPANTWIPDDSDTAKTLEIVLPYVNGVPPEEYEIMEVDISSTGSLGTVLVKIVDDGGKVVFNVCMNYFTSLNPRVD